VNDPVKNQTAVVTGASRGIGRAIALRLISSGVRVCLVGRDVNNLKEVAASCGGDADRVMCLQADLTVDDEVKTLAASLKRELSGVDILVHSAGVLHHGYLETASVEDFDVQFRANVRAPYLLTQLLLPLLFDRGGQVVFINSSIVRQAAAGTGQFSATQHALKAIADSFREEVNARGLRVLSVFPGRTATPRQEALFKKEGRPYKPEVLLQPDDVAQAVMAAISLPRTAELTNIDVRPFLKSY